MKREPREAINCGGIYVCPKCKYELGKKLSAYCLVCGQRIKIGKEK